MDRDILELQIAVAPMRGLVPTDKPLTERLQFAMLYVRQHKNELFWMTGRVTDETMFRAALAAVLLASNAEDRDLIKRSLMPMKMLAAATQGIPVNFEATEFADDLLPLVKLWNETAKETTP